MGAMVTGIAGAVIGGGLSYMGQRDANRANVGMSREQMQWEERMSNTAMQRRVADLKAAGLNPMLSYQNSASTPSYSPARVESTTAELGRGISSAAGAIGQQQLLKAQVSNTEAATRKMNAEASIAEASVPHSAANAANTARSIELAAQKLGSEADRAINETDMSFTDAEMKRQMFDIIIEYNRLVNQAKALEIPEKEALAEFYKKIPEAKWMLILKQMLK